MDTSTTSTTSTSTTAQPSAAQPPLPPVPQRSAADIEREQEAMLMARYGGLRPKKKSSSGGSTKEHKFFDSADWALAKQGVRPADTLVVPVQSVSSLEPKLEPTTVPPRRISHLGGEGDL